jgi:hypothetical protein
MVLRSDLVCVLAGFFACGCSPAPVPTSHVSAEPAKSTAAPLPVVVSSAVTVASASASAASSAAPLEAPVASASATSPAPPPFGIGAPASAAPTFSVQCVSPQPARHLGATPRACILRGRIRSVKPIDTIPQATWLQDGFTPPVSNRAFDVEIVPDDDISCPTPLDAKAKSDIRLREADYPDLSRSGKVRLLGAERISWALEAGKRICGWSRFVGRPGLNYPTGWEGELLGGEAKGSDWKLLGAYSLYLNSSTNKHLSKSWTFTREGAARRVPMDEGGAFIFHDAVRIQHKGKSTISKEGAEVSLKTSDGTFAVQATSDLTAGKTAVFVGEHDGFGFAAIRTEP